MAIHYLHLMLGSLQAIWGRREERSVYQERVNNKLSGGSLNQILEIIIKCTDEDDRGRIRSCDDEVTTCTITKLRNMIDGKVLYNSVV